MGEWVMDVRDGSSGNVWVDLSDDGRRTTRTVVAFGDVGERLRLHDRVGHAIVAKVRQMRDGGDVLVNFDVEQTSDELEREDRLRFGADTEPIAQLGLEAMGQGDREFARRCATRICELGYNSTPEGSPERRLVLAVFPAERVHDAIARQGQTDPASVAQLMLVEGWQALFDGDMADAEWLARCLREGWDAWADEAECRRFTVAVAERSRFAS